MTDDLHTALAAAFVEAREKAEKRARERAEAFGITPPPRPNTHADDPKDAA